MPKEEKLSLEKWHRKQAVDLFNATWTYLDKEKRTKDEDDAMVNASHASRYHWGVRVENNWDATPINLGRGDWQLSRVYAVIGDGNRAIHYGKTYLDVCKKEGIKDWDLAYAYEAIARGYAVVGDEKPKPSSLTSPKKLLQKSTTKTRVICWTAILRQSKLSVPNNNHKTGIFMSPHLLLFIVKHNIWGN